jgi:phosphotriesterase-related protein
LSPASEVPTVLGTIDAAAMGVTLGHEHLRFVTDAVRWNWPQRYDEQAELATAVAAIERATAHGVRTIIDPTAMNAGRDVRFMARVAEAAGVHVVACTGLYTIEHQPMYFEFRSTDQMADHFVEDIEQGIQSTDVRAGFIKTAADVQGVTEPVEKVHRAAARASVRTGAPIMCHSAPAAGNGHVQAAVLGEEGADLTRVQISHYGDTTDVDDIERLLATGVYVGLDRFGSFKAPFTAERTDVVAELIRRGHIERLILSHDYCPVIDWYPDEELARIRAAATNVGWSMSLVFEEVLPALLDRGAIDEDGVSTLLVDNPRRWLTGS